MKFEDVKTELYPNLLITNYGSVYLNHWYLDHSTGQKKSTSGTSIGIDLKDLNERALEIFNRMVDPAVNDGDNYFYCTECHHVFPNSEFEHSVFAAAYCKECAKKPSIAREIAASKRPRFYD